MADETETPPPSKKTSARAAVNKAIFTLGILVIVWLLFGQVVPRLLTHTEGEPPRRPHEAATAQEPPPNGEAKSRIDELEAKVKALEDVIAASPKTEGSDPRIDALQEKVDALQQASHDGDIDNARLAHLEEVINKQQEAILALKTQLADVQNKSSRQLAALTAFTSLRDAVQRGEPYHDQLTTLSQLTMNDARAQELLKSLAASADSGSVTLPALQSQFEATVPKALGNPGGLGHELQSLIRVRKVGEQQAGSDDQSVIARAEAKLQRDDVDAALKELQGLSPPAATAFSGWATKAQQFVRTRSIVEALRLRLAETAAEEAPAPAPAPAADKPQPPASETKPGDSST